jgi:tetratricopeptide (TPR) repeat protein
MRNIALAAALTLLAAAGTARAQFVIGPGWGFPGRVYSFNYRGYFGPYGYSPYYGWPPTVVVVPPPVVMVVPERSSRLQGVLDGLPQVPPPDEVDLLRRAKANPPPAPALPPEPIPKKAAAPPLRPVAALSKEEEAKRLLESGREALSEGEPGRAAEQFGRVTALMPNDATGYFLLGQALYSVGRYREAVMAILDGLKRKPDWPSAPFDARELYGPRAADHALDLELLRQALERNPNEPALAFLYGYELWFNGRKKEARSYLDKAAAGAADPAPIHRFLDAPR